MKKKIYPKIFIFLLMVICCESFDYVYVDNYTFQKQLSNISNGFVSVVLQIDPTKDDNNKKYVAPGKIIIEKVLIKNTTKSLEMIHLILEITKKNQRYSGEGWYPTYKIFIKYPDRFLFFFPSKKFLGVILDFKNSIIFIEGRKFVFNEQEAKLLQTTLDFLLNMPSP